MQGIVEGLQICLDGYDRAGSSSWPLDYCHLVYLRLSNDRTVATLQSLLRF